jgi:hypothetical protein
VFFRPAVGGVEELPRRPEIAVDVQSVRAEREQRLGVLDRRGETRAPM